MATVSRTRPRYYLRHERSVPDIAIHEPLRLSPGMTTLLATLLVTIVALAVGPTDAAIVFGSVAAVWLTGLIR